MRELKTPDACTLELAIAGIIPIERMKVVVRFELEIGENSILLSDDYVLHKNKKYGLIPIEL